jgi:hypothetical protein
MLEPRLPNQKEPKMGWTIRYTQANGERGEIIATAVSGRVELSSPSGTSIGYLTLVDAPAATHALREATSCAADQRREWL